MPSIDRAAAERLFASVQKPARYAGNELRAIVRPRAEFRMAVCYPDLYEVGMANNGIRILYHVANAVEGVACERVFAVAPDFEAALRETRIPLFTLETRTPLRELDCIGFNLSHELLATNVLQVLDLGGVPLAAADRRDGDPIVIGGGAAASNPFPFADFFDAFFAGDGEDALPEIIAALRGAGRDRAAALDALSRVGGVLIPGRYRFAYEGTRVTAVEGPAVTKRAYRGGALPDPPAPIVPNMRISQERAVVEVTRGCPNFCAFCHAGYYELPYRWYRPEDVAARIGEIIANTGYDELTLSSLSIGDYRHLPELINAVLPDLTRRGVSVSLPSLRVDISTLPVIEAVSGVRRSSLTLAVESASAAMRARARKRLDLADLGGMVRHVRSKGWRLVKLYFMLGLPGCEEEDECEGIISLLRDVAKTGVEINVTLSPFVPKPGTAFQRERQMGADYFLDAVIRIKRGSPRKVSIKAHDVQESILEGVFARGDARLGKAVLAAYRAGCRLDSWDEHFRYDAWTAALDGALPGWEACLGGRGEGDMLPWSVVRTGFEAAAEKVAAAPPRECGPPSRAWRGSVDVEALEAARRDFAARYVVAARVRICMTKTGLMRFVPHLDFLEIVKRALRMAGAPVAMSQGFNKRERMSAGYPVPIGVESEAELLDIELYGAPAADLAARMNRALPDGARVLSIRDLVAAESIMAATAAVEYRVECADPAMMRALQESCGAGVSFPADRKGPEAAFGDVVARAGFTVPDTAHITLRAGTGPARRIDGALAFLCKTGPEGLLSLRIVKTGQFRIEGGSLSLIG